MELAGVNVMEALRRARTTAPAPTPTSTYPTVREALPEFLARQVQAGEIRASTANQYRRRLATWAYPLLGDVTVDTVTRERIGQVIRKIREAGRSMAIVDGVRNPLKTYLADLIESKVLPGPNPAADLKHFIGRAQRKPRRRGPAFFSQEEGPQLVATAQALCPRWAPFVFSSCTGARMVRCMDCPICLLNPLAM
jgi:hypothetical protein